MSRVLVVSVNELLGRSTGWSVRFLVCYQALLSLIAVLARLRTVSVGQLHLVLGRTTGYPIDQRMCCSADQLSVRFIVRTGFS